MRDLSYDERLRREAACLRSHWDTSPRWHGIERTYSAEDVIRLRGTITIEHTLARLGADRLWTLMHRTPYVAALGAMTGGQALEMVKAGLDAVYVSGWQVAADANLALHTYPDQSLYPSNSVPSLIRRINNALQRADQIAWANGETGTRWVVPVVADAEAGFGGPLNAFETMKAMIEAGAAGVHFEDQLAGEKKCGHLGGKVLVPTSQFIRTLTAARLAADVLDVPTVLVARTDACAATLITSDVDQRDRPFLTGERTPEGFFVAREGREAAIARVLAYAPHADILWCETSTPDREEARQFAEAIHASATAARSSRSSPRPNTMATPKPPASRSGSPTSRARNLLGMGSRTPAPSPVRASASIAPRCRRRHSPSMAHSTMSRQARPDPFATKPMPQPSRSTSQPRMGGEGREGTFPADFLAVNFG
jgi:isocitrate lyase